MEPPIEPKSEDCCNSGCNPCIFDIYEQQLKSYKCGKKILEDKEENGISKLSYTKFMVVSSKVLCDSCKVLNFRGCHENKTKIWWNPGDHFLYKYVSETLKCTRAYTPIKLKSDESKGFDFSIVVRCYSKGLVSKHLFQLETGDLSLWRGPYGSYKIETNTFNRVIMIAQGTGIAPFISIIESILSNEDDMTKLLLFYCCQSVDEILFRDELCIYRSYWNFSYEIFISKTVNNNDVRYQEPINSRRFSYEDLIQHKPYVNDQFLICGSAEFIEFFRNVLSGKLDVRKNVISF